MESLNRMATELVDEAIDFAPELGIEVTQLSNETTVLDFGVNVPGGIEAGLLLTEIQTAGLVTLSTRLERIDGISLPVVELSTDQPALALLAAGKAGWELSVDEYDALGSGPARALVASEPIFHTLGYRDDFDFTVLSLEADALPTEAVAAHVAEMTGVGEPGVFLPTFASASITGSVVAASRAGELAAFRLQELGYDPRSILSVTAEAPVPPVPEEESTAMARATDATAYGGEVHLVVEEPFDRFDELPSTASDAFASPFADIFDSVDWDMTELDVGLFGPAAVTVDVLGGDVESYGQISPSILQESFVSS